MIGWLRDAAAAVGLDNAAHLGSIGWRVNRAGPAWGVWAEYPLCSGMLGMVWDECGDGVDLHPQWSLAPPSLEDLRAVGLMPRAILDIAIQHKGSIAYGIEIVHKHPIDDAKLAYLHYDTCITVIEIPAYWVLGQVGVPTEIPTEFFLSH